MTASPRRRVAGACLVSLLLAVAGMSVASSPVAAHPASTFFPTLPPGAQLPGFTSRWPFGRMDVQFTPTFPNSQVWRDRIQEAHANWPAATGRPPVYFWMTSNNWPFQHPCWQADNVNGVFYYDDEERQYVAAVFPCREFGHFNFNMVIHADVNHWVLDSAPTSTAYYDLEATATHEFGHAYGWVGHFNDVIYCTNNSSRETMCPSGSPGFTWMRSIELHDYHTMNAAYP